MNLWKFLQNVKIFGQKKLFSPVFEAIGSFSKLWKRHGVSYACSEWTLVLQPCSNIASTTNLTHCHSHIATFRKVPCCSANGATDQVTAIRLGLLHLKYLASSFDPLRASQQAMLFGHPVHNWKPGLVAQESDAPATILGWPHLSPRPSQG